MVSRNLFLTRRAAIGALVFAVHLGCNVQDLAKGGAELQADIHKELGVEARVRVGAANGRKVVRVVLEERPRQTLEVVRETIDKLVRRRVPDVDQVDIYTKL